MKKQTTLLTVTIIAAMFAVGLSVLNTGLLIRLRKLEMINATAVLSLCHAARHIEAETITLVDKKNNPLIEIRPDKNYGSVIDFREIPYSRSGSRFFLYSGERGCGFEMYGPDIGFCKRAITDFGNKGHDVIENIDFVPPPTSE